MTQEQNARAAGSYNENFEAYFSHPYQLSDSVKAIYPALEVDFTTPGFTKEDRSFTTQEEMMDFLYALTEGKDHVQLEVIGHSIEGREIPMLIFSKSERGSADFRKKTSVWLQAQIHGNEPAAGESALVIAQELAEGELGEKVLDDLNIIIVPRLNPDSSFYFERNSITHLNGNRDHINLEMPELQAVHEAFNEFLPEVVIDAHEYGAFPQYKHVGEEGALKYHDVLLLAGKNLNIPEVIREKSDDWFVDTAFKALEEKDLSHGFYYTVKDADTDQPLILEGGDDAGTGRNTFALKPSFSILVETLGIGIGRENFKRRVLGQVITHRAMILKAKEKAAEVKEIIRDSREKIKEEGGQGRQNGQVIFSSERTNEGDFMAKGIDIATGEILDIPARFFSATKAQAKESAIRPNAYLLPEAFKSVVEKLIKQGAVVEQLTADVSLPVEFYEVTERHVDNIGDRPLCRFTTELKEEERYFTKGSYLIRSAQSVGHIISLALEPASSSSFFAQGLLPSYPEGELPLYRYMGEVRAGVKIVR